MAKGAICFGLPSDRAEALAEFVDQNNLPVAIWPHVDALMAGGLSVFTEEVRNKVALVVLDRSYQRGSACPEPILGAGLTLDEQCRAINGLFPHAEIVYVTDRLLALIREFDSSESEFPGVWTTCYGSVLSGTEEDLKVAFERFLK